MKNRPVGADGQMNIQRLTDRRDAANSCFSQFCERA